MSQQKNPLSSEKKMLILQVIVPAVLFVLALQIWLFQATIKARELNDNRAVFYAVIASALCFVINLILLGQLRRVD